MARVLVAVVDPVEIYRRGLVACLDADRDLGVVCAVERPPLHGEGVAPAASGAGTREIAHAMHYSERTVKASISEVVRALSARNRAQAVAEGIRRGLI